MICLSKMPHEAQEGGGEFDQKFDIFSLGNLGICVMIQRAPHPLLAHTFIDDGERYARTEVQRRQVYLDEVKDNLDRGEKHPLYSVLVRCLHEDPEERPSCAEILGGSPFSDSDESKVPYESESHDVDGSQDRTNKDGDSDRFFYLSYMIIFIIFYFVQIRQDIFITLGNSRMRKRFRACVWA